MESKRLPVSRTDSAVCARKTASTAGSLASAMLCVLRCVCFSPSSFSRFQKSTIYSPEAKIPGSLDEFAWLKCQRQFMLSVKNREHSVYTGR